MSALRRMAAVAWIEALQLVRDRPSLSVALLTPVLQILLFGYAIGLEPRALPLAIAGPGSGRGEAVAQAIAPLPEVRIVAAGLPAGEAERRVRDGSAALAVELPVPPPPEAYAAAGPVRVVADAAEPGGTEPALAALAARAAARESGRGFEVVRLFNPERRAAWTLAPGLIGVIVMVTALMLGALALVRERETGTWETLLGPPVTPLEALAGKLAPYLVLAELQAAGALLFSRLAFGLPLSGAWGALLLATPLFAGAYLLLGFAISGVASTRLQAIQGAVVVYLPSILLSGFMFPFTAMPPWARTIAQALPLTHWVRAARDALLRGRGAETVVMEMIPVAAFALAAGAAALLACRRGAPVKRG